MVKIYIVKNEEAYDSLKEEFKEKGIEWEADEYEVWKYKPYWEIVVHEKKAKRRALDKILKESALKEIGKDVQIEIYEAKPEYKRYTFEEVMGRGWQSNLKLRWEYPDLTEFSHSNFVSFTTFLKDIATRFSSVRAYDILRSANFYVKKEED